MLSAAKSGQLLFLGSSLALPLILMATAAWGHADTVPTYFLEFQNQGKYTLVTVIEADAIEQGAHPGWSRSGPLMAVHAHPESGFPPVCRFDNKSSMAVYLSIDPAECAALSKYEQQMKAQESYDGPTFVGTAFYALPPQDGACPANSKAVYRADNGKPKDISHRYMTDALSYQAMAGKGWKSRGIVFCLPAEPPADAPKPGPAPLVRPEVDAAKVKEALGRFYGEDSAKVANKVE